MYTIGRLARRAKVNTDSIRFYERQELLTPETKTDAGYRLYTEDALRRIAFIKHAQRCGFSLAEIRDLLKMHTASAATRQEIYRLAAQKQTEMRTMMDSLQAMSAALAGVLSSRSEAADEYTLQLAESPVLAALEASLSQQRLAGTNAQGPRLAA